MSEVAFTVEEGGDPVLGDQVPDQLGGGPDPGAPAAPLRPVTGWTAEEGSRVVGGVVSSVVLALYAFRHRAVPDRELWPAIAGDPVREFPLLGAGLAPVLDFVAPKGSPAAVGVSLGAGLGEIVGALSRRAAVLDTPPRSSAQQGRPQPPSAPPPAAAPAEGGFRYRPEELRVLQGADSPLAGVGID